MIGRNEPLDSIGLNRIQRSRLDSSRVESSRSARPLPQPSARRTHAGERAPFVGLERQPPSALINGDRARQVNSPLPQQKCKVRPAATEPYCGRASNNKCPPPDANCEAAACALIGAGVSLRPASPPACPFVALNSLAGGPKVPREPSSGERPRRTPARSVRRRRRRRSPLMTPNALALGPQRSSDARAPNYTLALASRRGDVGGWAWRARRARASAATEARRGAIGGGGVANSSSPQIRFDTWARVRGAAGSPATPLWGLGGRAFNFLAKLSRAH